MKITFNMGWGLENHFYNMYHVMEDSLSPKGKKIFKIWKILYATYRKNQSYLDYGGIFTTRKYPGYKKIK